MKYTVDMNDRPVYLQIYRLLRADIVGGAFAYGSRLPSKRLLAEELGVSTVTTEHAYDLLCEEGYAQARERSGYFVIFKRSDGFAASGGNFSEPAQEKHLGHSKPVFPVSLLSRTMRKVIADRADEILERSPHKGLMELRDALRQYLARNRGINVDAEQIIVGSGAEYLCWAEKGGRFIVESDYDSEFSVSQKPADTLFALSEQDNVIYLNTFSKTISPSMRVGYMVLPKRLVKTFEERLGFYSCTVPTFEQLVLTELLNSGDFERHINRVRRAKRRELNKT